MGAKFCIVTGEEITSENDSKAHVIPSAMGGRLKPKGFLSKAGNNILDKKVDNPLTKAYQPIMSMLGGSRDKGNTPPAEVLDKEGRAIHVPYGKPMTLRHPELKVQEMDGRVEVGVLARTMKEARTLLGSVEKKYPQFDIDSAMEQLNPTLSTPRDCRLHLQLGPFVDFPAAFVAASLFSFINGYEVHPGFGPYISAKNNGDLPPDTFYLYLTDPFYQVDAVVSHSLILFGDASRQRMLVYVEYFNLACIGVLLPFKGKKDVLCSYAVDVLQGQEVPVEVDVETLKSTSWEATPHFDSEDYIEIVTDRMARLSSVIYDRSAEAEISRMVNEAFAKRGSLGLTQGDYNEIMKKVGQMAQNKYSVSSEKKDEEPEGEPS